MKRRKKIAVIGSGFGGLSAAIRLLAKGHDVTIYEKLDHWGGRAYQYQVNGFKIIFLFAQFTFFVISATLFPNW